MTGRPSSFDQAIADAICEEIAEGTPLRQICRREDRPAWRTVYNWRQANPEFAAALKAARDMGHDAIAEDAIEIADDARNDWMEKEKSDGSTYEAFNAEHVQRSKLRIETRLKLLAKWDPARYGERLDLNHTGQAQATVLSSEPISEEAWANKHGATDLGAAAGATSGPH